jgi:hypothetical protein
VLAGRQGGREGAPWSTTPCAPCPCHPCTPRHWAPSDAPRNRTTERNGPTRVHVGGGGAGEGTCRESNVSKLGSPRPNLPCTREVSDSIAHLVRQGLGEGLQPSAPAENPKEYRHTATPCIVAAWARGEAYLSLAWSYFSGVCEHFSPACEYCEAWVSLVGCSKEKTRAHLLQASRSPVEIPLPQNLRREAASVCCVGGGWYAGAVRGKKTPRRE